jgi:hypothetical protein
MNETITAIALCFAVGSLILICWILAQTAQKWIEKEMEKARIDKTMEHLGRRVR